MEFGKSDKINMYKIAHLVKLSFVDRAPDSQQLESLQTCKGADRRQDQSDGE